jgi:hypothetical protein
MRLKKIAFVCFALLICCTGIVFAEHKSEPVSQSVPDTVSAEIKNATMNTGLQILGDDGKPLLKVWVAKSAQGSSKPAGPKGNILFPFLSEGQFLGVVEVLAEIGDYRDQPIVPGVYTFRYGIQPVNGDHLGASPYRDFGCLIPSAVDKNPGILTKKVLEKNSAEAAGTSHPAIMMFLAPAQDSKPGQIFRDDENDRSSIVLPLEVESDSEKSPVMIQWIFQGRAPV